MTSKLGKQTGWDNRRDYDVLEKFPGFPPRDDMQNSLHLDDQAHQAALVDHFGNQETTLILSEIPVRPTPGGYPGVRIPDLLIAFGVDRTQAVEQNGYSIRDQGKPPDFVLEIASTRTAENDYTQKRLDYAAFGIPEYWRFDPTGGESIRYTARRRPPVIRSLSAHRNRRDGAGETARAQRGPQSRPLLGTWPATLV